MAFPLFIVAFLPPASALDDPDPETLPVAEPLRRMAVTLPAEVLDDLRARRWKEARPGIEAIGLERAGTAEKGALAFLLAWTAIHGDAAAGAAPLLPLLDAAPDVPETYAELVRGEVLLASGAPLDALVHLERVPTASVVSPRAVLRRAEALRALGRTSEAWALLEDLAARPDPAEGNPEALLLLADRAGAGSPKATEALRRIWTYDPGSDADREATRRLGDGFRAPWPERAIRAERQLAAGASAAALATLDGVAVPTGATVDACRFRFTRGRSLYKLNRLTEAAAALGGIAEDCVEVAEDYGPRAAYLLGTAEFRRKSFLASAAAYDTLARLYPSHSMADDGLTRGGIALLEAGRPADAEATWRRALDTYPLGDTVPEATLRLAFARYLAGDPAGARTFAGRLGTLPLAGDAVHVLAGRYWAARWELYPTAADPDRVTTDAAARARGLAGLVTLCREHPQSYYAILAASRVRDLDPSVALDRPVGPSIGVGPATWDARVALLRDPAFRDGLGLLRLGLAAEARAEWGQVDENLLLPDEMGWITELRVAAGDWLAAHDTLRRWLEHHPLGTLGPHEAHLVRVAWPDRYWSEVKAAVDSSYAFEPRLFHALVREESNFDRSIVSFAGARGLSQLMPATARQTAGWLGLNLASLDALNKPEVNLPIGARYLEAMHRQLGGSPFLALAAYNGGAANVTKWIGETGNPPTDELVERIPFEETRGYVKRVMASWQTMRWAFDPERGAFPDVSRYVHQARPE